MRTPIPSGNCEDWVMSRSTLYFTWNKGLSLLSWQSKWKSRQNAPDGPGTLLLNLQLWGDFCSPAICHFRRHGSPMLVYKAITQPQVACGRSVLTGHDSLAPFLTSRIVFLLRPNLPPSPFHTPGLSGFKASSRGFKSHLCFPSTPPGSFARSDGSCFRKLLRR